MNTETTNIKGTEMEGQEEKKKSKKWWIIGGVVIVLLLAASAFMGRMWMVGRATGMTEMADPEAMMAAMLDVEELPDEAPDVVGRLSRLDGNSLFVSTTSTTGAFQHGLTASEGPTVEVVITRDTILYADVTFEDFDFSSRGGQGSHGEGGMSGMSEMFTADRVIEPGVLEDIETNTNIVVWGERTGDRITATTVLYIVEPLGMEGYH